MIDTCPRLIEVALPIREISAESVRDKSLRHGHISTLHLWWARRQFRLETQHWLTRQSPSSSNLPRPSSKSRVPEAESGTPAAPEGKPHMVQRFTVHGAVPVESWADLFRCFISPAARMNLKKLRLGIQFEMELPDGQGLDLNDATLKAMRESARQLGLTLKTDE